MKIPRLAHIKKWYSIYKNLSLIYKILFISVCIAGILFVRFYLTRSDNQDVQYETTVAENGTFISTISASGTITTGNTTSITTGATGTVDSVYVKNGDTVQKGDPIAKVLLDQYGQKRLSAAWLSYINAQNSAKTALADKNTYDIQMWEYRQDILDAEEDIEYKNNHSTNPETDEDYTLTEKTVIDKTLDLARSNFAAAELKYKNADAAIQNANVRVSSAWYDYQQVSAIITAPESGIVQNLILAPGSTISNSSDSSISISDGTISSNSSNTTNTLTASSQSVGTVQSPEGQFKATVNLSEVDIPMIQSGQKVTLTMDAFPDNTFTGSVLAVDTNGNISSGVTTYPVTILLDPTSIQIYPKMAVNVHIITLVKHDTVTVPSTAIQTDDNGSIIQIMKDGTVRQVSVEIGSSNDTQTEILSGISVGDIVVISTASTTGTNSSGSSTQSGSSSLFGGGIRGMGGGMFVGGPPDH